MLNYLVYLHIRHMRVLALQLLPYNLDFIIQLSFKIIFVFFTTLVLLILSSCPRMVVLCQLLLLFFFISIPLMLLIIPLLVLLRSQKPLVLIAVAISKLLLA